MTGLAQRADDAVMTWVAAYVADLEPDVAVARRDELASDLWEQRAAARDEGRGDLAVATAILSRAARGAGADVAWRSARLRGASVPRLRIAVGGWTRFGSAAALLLTAAIGIGVGVLAFARIASALARHLPYPSDATMTSLLVGAAAIVVGCLLLRRARHRWLAPLWIGFGVLMELWFAGVAISAISVSASAFRTHLALTGSDGIVAALAGTALGALALFFIALSVTWLPRRPSEETP
jgi:hypothetical protein